MNLQKHTQSYTRMAVVGALHLGLIMALLHSMKISINKPLDEVFAVVTPPPPPAEPPKVKINDAKLPDPPKVYIPKPEVALDHAPKNPIANGDTTPPTNPGDQFETGSGAHETVGETGNQHVVKPEKYIAPVVDMTTCEKPQYPNASIRNMEEGITTLAMHISSNGKVIETRVDRSSGFRGLDRAAQTALARCSFKPGSRNGVSEASWAKVEYVWKLD